MKREPWAIANTFAYAIRVLNCIFCRHPKKEGWTEDDVEASHEIKLLVAEQVNHMCSDMMMEDAEEILVMVRSIPTGRLCEEVECRYHHPEDPYRSSYVDVSKDKCGECTFNKDFKLDSSKQKSNFSRGEKK